MPVKKPKPAPKKAVKINRPKPVKKVPMAVKKAIEPKKILGAKELGKGVKYLYYFGDGKAEGNGKMKDLLGGKGAGLAEMTNSGVPVPPGFTITTEACNLFYKNNMAMPSWFEDDMKAYMATTREINRHGIRRQDKPAFGFGSLRRQVLHARHDGYDPESRPQRRDDRGADQED